MDFLKHNLSTTTTSTLIKIMKILLPKRNLLWIYKFQEYPQNSQHENKQVKRVILYSQKPFIHLENKSLQKYQLQKCL